MGEDYIRSLRTIVVLITSSVQRALLAVAAGLVVALAEIVLYMIWTSRRTASHTKKIPRILSVRENGDGDTDDPVQVPVHATSTALHDQPLRHRRADAINTDM